MTLQEPAALRASMLRIEGPDALRFAHAQFTSHVLSLEIGAWQWSAWLDARGRVHRLFHLLRPDEHHLLLALRGGDAEIMVERLHRFVFRDKVTLQALPPLAVHDDGALAEGIVQQDNEDLRLGMGDHGLRLSPEERHDTAWRRRAIERGEPWLPDAFADTFLPPALGLRRLRAMQLDKGCFPGQEIAARLHYRGGHKHALMHVRLAENTQPGSTLEVQIDHGEPVSLEVLDCIGNEALVVAHERAQSVLPRGLEAATQPPYIVRVFAP
ncbi:folate-binding protein YgfZ [Oleiagrimonas sp. MCCC 1A03011]|uniref:CAF17-like 4Fe-4S cluster assembly/insertion protein YgfZ n=1 Tax=Oleiagrimonas sp. MCCC 1A03011 TaxID=1926883 RepID=UPI000DC4825F|nr:folate-binding protein YgfZ [Oleiagrimonas sp. MCCC 1A03011]RAP58021.1 hypothetical protein BTJ49_09255 [Oleiagrimonas sp. MCCC 1A03011]